MVMRSKLIVPQHLLRCSAKKYQNAYIVAKFVCRASAKQLANAIV
jgi:hypothetical protein